MLEMDVLEKLVQQDYVSSAHAQYKYIFKTAGWFL